MRRLTLALAATVCLLGARSVRTRAEVTAGLTLSCQARDGVVVREAARPLAKVVTRLPYATRVRVEEVVAAWARITATEGATGWVRSSELVPPSALTGAGNEPTHTSTPADVLAAGRQFDAKTEKFYRAIDKGYDGAYPAVDAIEHTKPGDAELYEFIRSGALGGTATMSEVGAHFAKVTLVGAVDTPEAITIPEEPPVVGPPAITEEEFVRRLGLGFSPEQEYWLGRAVAAAAIAEHGLDKNEKNQALVRKVGATLVALCSRVRSTHGGWHFAVLDDPAPNAISGPGGFVLITRGALELARNEDEVAGVLAHEMAHVSKKHGEAMVRKSREFQEELVKLQQVVAQPQKGTDACKICWEVARTLGTTSKTLAKTLDKEGYGKDFELEADWDGSLYLCEAGYRASAIAEYLELLPDREHATWTTHPSPDGRIDSLRPIIAKHGCPFDADTGAQIRLPRWRALAGNAVPTPVAPAR
jgi:hypothetical protein